MWCRSYRLGSGAAGPTYYTTRARASMRSHAHVCVRHIGSGGSTCNGEHRRRGSVPPGLSIIPTTPATQHNKHDRCMVAFQSSCTCARHAHARDGLSQRFCLSIGVQLWVESSFFPFLFFQKESGKQEVGVPSLPGGGWGGDGRVHASGANLDPYPAGFYYFYFIISI